MPAGRPTSYKEEYCEQLIDHCKEGYSRESFTAVIHVNRDTLYEWCKAHKEFSDAWKKCVNYRLRALEDLVMKHAKGKIRGSTAAALFMLRNIAPEMYKERTEVTHKDYSKIDTEELKKEAAQILGANLED